MAEKTLDASRFKHLEHKETQPDEAFNAMFFFVRHMSGSDQARYRVKVGNINDKIEHVRSAIQAALGGPQVAPIKRTRLIFKGKQVSILKL